MRGILGLGLGPVRMVLDKQLGLALPVSLSPTFLKRLSLLSCYGAARRTLLIRTCTMGLDIGSIWVTLDLAMPASLSH